MVTWIENKNGIRWAHSEENTYTSKITQTEWVVFKYLAIEMFIQDSNKKAMKITMNLKENHWGI